MRSVSPITSTTTPTSGATTVSYTHLDVYKRQAIGTVVLAQVDRHSQNRLCHILGGQIRAIGELDAPVSYTHLDVYKRQAYGVAISYDLKVSFLHEKISGCSANTQDLSNVLHLSLIHI